MLQVNGVSKTFAKPGGSVRALTDVSFSVKPGERVGLIGKSGAGKSTLAQIMALLMRPDKGSVSVDGSVVRGWGLRLPASVRQQVQLLWQSPRASVNPRFTIEKLIAEPLRYVEPAKRPEAAERLKRLQQRVGLSAEILGRHPHAVSDGQLQRACFVRALVLQPKYLICDEFTAMVDASTQASLLNALAEQQVDARMGIALITHDHQLARNWCDRLVEMNDGCVISKP